MRRLFLACLPLLIGVGAATAQDTDKEKELRRTAVEAKLKIAELLREKGDLAGAIKAAKEAIALWERSEFEEVKGDQPFTGPDGGPWIKGKNAPRPERMAKFTKAKKPVGNAISLGIHWLANHQDEDGRWDNNAFSKHDPADDKTDGPGHALFDIGATGLATLAFLSAGYTDRGSVKENPYARNVRQGLRFLMVSQDEAGCFGRRNHRQYIYGHAIATVAMCDAYLLTRNPRYKRPASAALRFILRSRNPEAGWRYGIQPGENDASVTAWCVMALATGKAAGFQIDPVAFAGALRYIQDMTDESGITSYTKNRRVPARPEGLVDKFPPEHSQSMTAAGIVTRFLCGQRPNKAMLLGAKEILKKPPIWNPDSGSIDMYYWYFGSMAMHRLGGAHWRLWAKVVHQVIVTHQHPKGSGARMGSWDPIGVWGNEGGRIYSTALMVLALETPYR